MSKMKIKWETDQWGCEYTFLGPKPTKTIYQYMLIDDRVEETKEIIVHTFTMGDVEDPDLYAAQPLWEWQETEQGKWVMEHAVETPVWHRMADAVSYGYRYTITAKFQGARLTEWLLRHGK
jgi:hypothetical protein